MLWSLFNNRCTVIGLAASAVAVPAKDLFTVNVVDEGVAVTVYVPS